MTDAYQPEQAEAEIARQEAHRQGEMESQLARARPAEANQATTLSGPTEGQAMRTQLVDPEVSAQVMAGQRLDAAAPAATDASEPGQMTDAPSQTPASDAGPVLGRSHHPEVLPNVETDPHREGVPVPPPNYIPGSGERLG